ncbi:peptide ABC transporter substrate-binding protein [Paenibacillus crassostreae]|uniref:Peptide-binding protein n=1 Tax=Paenibacillus crassostreae TaxID=1763538 RepID=A0A167C3F8_9BACL|nr:peptide ABC transporter substrate-binding protein [Paenibacillus crassostreae]AOZ91691.1 peptide-binding protein [Paenibacillus crassostreae]OAB72736.1 peptide-binding protein [Paenibacillus crassostreae]
MKQKRLLSMLILIMIASTVLAACGSNNKNEGASNTGSNATTETPVEAKDQVFHFNMASEPPTFDPGQAQDSQANTALNLMYEGLVRMDESGKEIPAAAESWEISPDGLQYKFNLRKDAVWSNGDPVTANDFVFAWQRVLDPATTPAPPYAYQLGYIKNANAYNAGDITDFTQVGAKATDDYTLEITLENPTPYFLGLTSFYTYFPVHSSVKDNDKWATDYATMITNGEFVLSNWTTGQKLEFTKNDKYWDKDNIKFTKIEASLVNSGAAELSSYKSGQLDYAGKPTGEIPSDSIPSVKKDLPNEFEVKGIASTYYYEFNVTAKPFDNAKIRKAFTMSIDRQAIVEKVTLGGELPAYGFVPPGIKGNADEFRNEYKDAGYFTEDVEAAKKLLAEGMAEEGYTTLPEVTLIYNTTEGHKKIALAVADMWKNNLGVTVKTENLEWGVFLETRQNLNYQIARAAWSADYNDPMTFIDMWTTGGGNNDSGFANAEYDQLVKDAQASQDNAVRMESLSKAEKILIQDEQVLMPIYYYTNVSLTKENVKGISIDFSGAIDFSRAYFE